MISPGDRRGLFLPHVMMFLLVLGLIGGAFLQLTLGRAAVVHRTLEAQRQRLLAQGAEARARDCVFGRTSCDASCDFSEVMDGRRVSARVNASCAIAIEVEDAP